MVPYFNLFRLRKQPVRGNVSWLDSVLIFCWQVLRNLTIAALLGFRLVLKNENEIRKTETARSEWNSLTPFSSVSTRTLFCVPPTMATLESR